MSSAAVSELDGLFHQLQRRMVESGEWDRILLQLRYQLRDAGWMDSTHAQMLEHANANGMEQPAFRELLDETRTRTNDVPEAVKLQILSSIRSFVEKQIE